MTNIPVTYKTLEETRERLIGVVNKILTNQDKEFLLSVKRGVPNWEYLGIPNVERLPGVAWKLINIKRMEKNKHQQAVANLEQALYKTAY